MKLGLSLELTIPSDVQTSEALLLLGRMYAPPGTVTPGDPLTVPEAVEYLFRHQGGVSFLATMGVTWDAVHTGEVVHDVTPAIDSRQRLDNQPG